MVWRDLRLKPGLPNHWLTLYPLGQWAGSYSNILHILGKQAISFWVEKYLRTLHTRFNKRFITDIELILKNNSFQFNNKPKELQWEPKYMNMRRSNQSKFTGKSWKHWTKYGTNIRMDFIWSWKRYLNDCFISLKCSWGKINDINNVL